MTPAIPEYVIDPDRTHAVIGHQLMVIDQLRRELEKRSTEVNEWHDKYLAEKQRADELEDTATHLHEIVEGG